MVIFPRGRNDRSTAFTPTGRTFNSGPPRSGRAIAFALTVVIAVGVLSTFPSAPATSVGSFKFKRVEKCFMRKINNHRARRGRHRLRWDRQLGYVARLHARAMAAARSVWHDGRLGVVVTRWRRLGQNVGTGAACWRLFRRFWRSPTHRDNILGRWRFVGVGVVFNRGRLYVQQVFEARANPGNIYQFP